MKLNFPQPRDDDTQSRESFIMFNSLQMSISSVFILISEKNSNCIPPNKVALYDIKMFSTR